MQFTTCRAARAIFAPALFLLASLLTLSSAHAQPEAPPDTVRAWYDTLEVTRPRYARATVGERLALAAFTALALPVAMTVGATTILPPMVNLLVEDGREPLGITAGTGVGFGGDSTREIYYPDFRVQLDVGYYFGRERALIVHAAVAKDIWIASIHPQDLMAVGAAVGAGIASDAHTYSPFVEATAGFVNPLGIRFVPLFPMHNYGLRGRLGYNPASGTTWYEVSLGMTSTFGG